MKESVTVRAATMVGLVLFACAGWVCAEEKAKEGEWATAVHARALEKDPAVKAYIREESHVKLLVGPGLVSIDECKKDRIWVIKGKESADGKTIEVKEMKERVEWSGEVTAVREGKDKPWVPTLSYKAGFALELKGKVADIEECKKKDKWTVKGRLSDDLKSVEVTEMTKLTKKSSKDKK